MKKFDEVIHRLVATLDDAVRQVRTALATGWTPGEGITGKPVAYRAWDLVRVAVRQIGDLERVSYDVADGMALRLDLRYTIRPHLLEVRDMLAADKTRPGALLADEKLREIMGSVKLAALGWGVVFKA